MTRSIYCIGDRDTGRVFREKARVFLDWVVEVGKGLPRVVMGVVIGGGMRVVRGVSAPDNDLFIRSRVLGGTVASIGFSLLVIGGVLLVGGVSFNPCVELVAYREGRLEGEEHWRRIALLSVFLGSIIWVSGFILTILGIVLFLNGK